MKILNQFKRIAILFFVCIGFLYPSISNGQFWMNKYGYLGNYFEISDSTEWWFNQDTNRVRNPVYGYKSFARWRTFLSSRVNIEGTLDDYVDNYNSAVDQIRSRSNNNIGNGWNSLGPIDNTQQVDKSYLGIVTSLKVVDNDMTTIYAGSGTGGLFVTHDGGAHWECLTENYGVTGVEAIIVSPDDPDEIYIGTGFDTWGRKYGMGVWKTTDGGLYWNPTSLDATTFGNNYIISGMCQDPNNTSTLFAIVNSERIQDGTHLMKTVNGGSNWDDIYHQNIHLKNLKRLKSIQQVGERFT